MAEIVNLGSLYLNGQPKDLGVEYNGEVLSFGNTIPGKTIPFVKWGKLLVASQCICTNISWDELNKAGYIFGWPVKIDGAPYLCRSLKVGEERDVPNEWDSILDDLGEDDGLWHWSDGYFWGQETSRHLTSFRAVRGWESARYWNYYAVTARSVDVGFRPVLEPLPPAPMISGSLIGAGLKVYGPDADIAGELVEVTDYDLVIELPRVLSSSALNVRRLGSNGSQWAHRDGYRLTIDRSAIIWMEKID